MLKSVKGIYRDGKVVLLETPGDLTEGKVIVTFLAGRIRIGRATISRYRSGASSRFTHQVEQICRGLGTTGNGCL